MNAVLQREWVPPKKRRKLMPVVPGWADSNTPSHETRRPSHTRRAPVTNRPRRVTPAARDSLTVSRAKKASAKSTVRWYYWMLVGTVMVMTFLLLGASILRYNQMSEINRQIRTTSRDIEALQAEHDTLTMQLAPYMETGRIEKMAKQLGMVYPSRLQRQVATRNPAALIVENRENALAETSHPSETKEDAEQSDVARTR